jgi:type IV pilus assembly protein PilE
MKLMPASLQPRHRRAAMGFTLIEVMIVVAIIGILAAIAYPSYREYIMRGRMVDGTNGLAEMRARMERHFQDNRDYQNVPGFNSPCNVAQTYGDFVVTCAAVGPTTYRLEARATAGTIVDGFVFAVDEQDRRGTVAPAGSGWTSCPLNPPGQIGRWITKKGVPCN